MEGAAGAKGAQYRPVQGTKNRGNGGAGYQNQGGFNPSMVNPQVMSSLPSLMTAQQKQEQFQAMQQKLVLKSSLTEMCDKHSGSVVLFEKPTGKKEGEVEKICEKCFFEIQEKAAAQATPLSTTTSETEIAPAVPGQSQVPPFGEEQKIDSETQPNKQQRVNELHLKIQSQLNSLSAKMQRKVDDLNVRYQQLAFYEKTLKEKFHPVFQLMRSTVRERELDYMTYLLKQLDQNKDRIMTEKISYEKLMRSFHSVDSDFKTNLESQMHNIELQDKESQRIIAKEEAGVVDQPETPATTEPAIPKVDTYQVDALSTMVDDFENIVAKNYCVYTNYEDFSFAQSRSIDKLDGQFKDFVQMNFSGDYQMKNWFNSDVLPRIILLQQNTKFIYTYKILHNNSECQHIQNTFQFPEKCRHIVTQDGHLFVTGGFQSTLKVFLNNTFIMDDHRCTLVPLQKMKTARADHAILCNKGQIFVFGGMSFKQGSQNEVQSISSCEMYNIKEDKWSELPPMTKPKQSFSVCLFNEKYIFAFGGKCLTEGATLKNQSFDFSGDVEVFDTERGLWKSINYIAEAQMLKLINAGSYQCTGKKIMIFGGEKPYDPSDKSAVKGIDNGQQVTLSNETLFFNVSNGEIKKGTELSKASYFISGGSVFPQNGTLHAFGFTTIRDHTLGYLGLSGELQPQSSQQHLEINPNINRKTYHYFKVSDDKWQEVQESVFTGQRKMSIDTLDEAL